MDSVDLGIDLGTASVVICGENSEILLNEPAVVAFNRETRVINAVGEYASMMLGRTPTNIVAMRPLGNGTVQDYDMASAMLRTFIARVQKKRAFKRPRIVLAAPLHVNKSELHNLRNSLFSAGVSRTLIVEKPIAVALGANLNMEQEKGIMICDIGGGTTEISVLFRGKIIVRGSFDVGGNAFDDSIINYIRRKHSLLIGEVTAEDLKINIGSVVPHEHVFMMEVSGRNLITNLPRSMKITSSEITEAMDGPVQNLLESIQKIMERTPAELLSDIQHDGILLAGGGALLNDLSDVIADSLNISCTVIQDPQTCVARGCARILYSSSHLNRYLSDERDMT